MQSFRVQKVWKDNTATTPTQAVLAGLSARLKIPAGHDHISQ